MPPLPTGERTEAHIQDRTTSLARRFVARAGPLAPLAVVAVLALVAGIAVWGASETGHSTDAVERARTLDDLYERARNAVSDEAEAHATYLAAPQPAARRQYNVAATELTTVLEELGQHGQAMDRDTATRIGAMHGRYLQLDARMFAALDRGDRATASQDDAVRVNALFDRVRAAVDQAAERHRRVVTERIAGLHRTTRMVSTTIPAVGVVGMALVAFFASVMVSYRRQAKEAADREIARLAAVALTDNLTGLGNHRALHEELDHLAAASWSAGEPFTVLALDLDGLKHVNDTIGHHEGDRLILRLADGLRETLPARARAYRIGGDEFVAVLPGLASIDGFHYSQELQTLLAPPSSGILARVGDETVAPTHVTVGICDAAGADGDPALTLHRADLALIEAKRVRGRGLIWSSSIEVRGEGSAEADHRRMLATALAKAVDAKDSYTRSHCETVSQLCVLIAEQLGMGTDDIESLRLAGLLHDVGKIGVPDAILQKPSGLTDEEFEQMQGHSTLGHSIVAAAGLHREAEWVRHHHERMDGRGYPDRIGASDIPLQSRIIFVADAFEAITSDRPYRLGRPVGDALEELLRCAGTQFDTDCVDALVRAMDRIGPATWMPASSVERLHSVQDAVDDADRAARRAA